MTKPVNIGIVGCGNISQAYFNGVKQFPILNLVGCADLNRDVAKAKAGENNTTAMSVDELIAHPDVEIVVNLTIPGAHADVALQALEAGKHTHCEKPLAVTLQDGKKVIDSGKAKNLLVGCAPDTFLGTGIQTSRKVIDDGWIGKPVAGTAFMQCHGHESWHPNPGFYYLAGGGPMFDMGPYYLTALVNMLGPAKRVAAISSQSFDERVCTCEARKGEKLPVEVTTHLAGTLEFVNGAIITVVMSFDVWGHTNHNIEIHGTAGSMQVPDPNGFGGDIKVKRPGGEWSNFAHSGLYADNSRGIGVADMAHAIRGNRPFRCNGDLAYHVLEIMHAFDRSSESGQHVMLESTVEQPAAFPLDMVEGVLD